MLNSPFSDRGKREFVTYGIRRGARAGPERRTLRNSGAGRRLRVRWLPKIARIAPTTSAMMPRVHRMEILSTKSRDQQDDAENDHD